MPIEAGGPAYRAASASAPSEIAWILNLLTQTARYAGAALAELDANLLPGVVHLRAPMTERTRQLWQDGAPGCTELLLCAHWADGVLDDGPQRLFAWLRSGAVAASAGDELVTEPESDRVTILARLARLRSDARARDAYHGILADVWSLAAPELERLGRDVVGAACNAWETRLETGERIDELVPPRHPLTRMDRADVEQLLSRRAEVAVSPIYFCMSGGHVVDLGEFLHVGVPASDLLPVRKVRDAAFVADRLRVLAEPTRVRILLQTMGAPAGVMELARALRISQPAVSGHLKVLRAAGLVKPQRRGGRSVFVASRGRVERLLEDARATIARWE